MRNRLPETGRSFIRLCLSSPKLGEPRIARNLCLLLQCIEKIADLVGPFQRILAENRPQKFQQLNRETLGNTIFTHEEWTKPQPRTPDRLQPRQDDLDNVGEKFRHGKRQLCKSFRNPLGRSEEHTSELQSLMRISYAVFCLKN